MCTFSGDCLYSGLWIHKSSVCASMVNVCVYTRPPRFIRKGRPRCTHTRAVCIHMEHTCTHKPSTRCIHEALTASGSWIWQLKKKLGGGRGLQKHQVRTGRQASKALLGSVAWTDKWEGEPAMWRTTGLSEDGYRPGRRMETYGSIVYRWNHTFCIH